ncbi:MAG: PQQ-binding-like beta-propeller repeat protein [Candidatus Obscuribacter sp.]|nr:PQQ-binding-like beta-propeller repeat protein [Candidatus Obscuribacter sp.]
MPPRIFARGEKLEDGHYTVLEEIGVGGMGVVYHCRDELLLRDVAVKMLLPGLMADKKNLDVFREEARLAAQLEHPNIVTVYDIGVESRAGRDHHFVAMEYLPGGNLAARVTQGPLPLEHCLHWMKQLASGLSFAHKRGVIHQDVKADNIFITNEGDLKIGDFGLARLLVGRVYLNSATKGMGTPAYMSPELCRGEQQDHRSDIYSMGILFFEMCTGQLPFRAQGMIEMAMKHTSSPVPSAHRLNPLVPDVLDRVIKRMMAKTPDERYRSMTDVLGIIDDLIFELRVARMGLSNRLDPKRLDDGDSQSQSQSQIQSNISATENPPKPQVKDPADLVKQRDLPEEKLKQIRAQSKNRDEGVDTTKVVKTSTGNPEAAAQKAAEQTSKNQSTASEQTAKNENSPGTSKDLADQSQSAKPAPDQSAQKSSNPKIANTPQVGSLTNTGTSQGAKTNDSKNPGVSHNKLEHISSARSTSIPEVTRWTFKTSGPIGWSTTPVLNREGNIIYCPSSDGRLYAIQSTDGKAVFKYDCGAPVLTTPLYTADKLIVSDCLGQTHALDPQSGKRLWLHQNNSGHVASPALHGNTAIICDLKGLVCGLDVRTGRKLWQFNAQDAIMAQPKVHGDSFYFGTRGGSVYSLASASGKLNWKYVASGRIVSTPATSVDTVYMGTQTGAFFALDVEAGRLIWEYPVDGVINRGGLIVFTSIMFASSTKWLYCCEKYDGTLKWKAPLKGRPAAALLNMQNVVVSLSRDGWLEGFDTASGALKWRLFLHKEVEAQPLIADGKIYIASIDGEINCLDFVPDLKAKVSP